MMSETRRLHISGLNPGQCSVQDLHARFASFQLQVRDVFNWPPGEDGVGKAQNWCFLTVEGEAAKIKRATDVLNGTIWKGSKLRIGTASKEQWRKADEVVEEEAEKEKKKKKRRARGVESDRIHQPVTAHDVDAGLWGWKKTPAGHLIRPLHMRPAHPLPRPIAGPSVVPNDGKEKAKRRPGPSKPMTRARRVTVDPSRYGAIHLSGLVLDEGADGLPEGSGWMCEETEEGSVKWTLQDSTGAILLEEIVVLRRLDEADAAHSSEAEIETESGSDESSMDEVAEAISKAAAQLSSDSEDEEVRLPSKQAGVQVQPFQFESFDPAEESDFSDGYQETQPTPAAEPQNWKIEKQGHLDLLKNMFGGASQLPASPPPPMPVATWEEESESEQDEGAGQTEEIARSAETSLTGTQDQMPAQPVAAVPLTGAQKRAALLGGGIAANESSQFRAVVRFDPGSDLAEEDELAEEETQMQEVEAEQSLTEAPTMVPRPDRVEMSSLKDMFRPKEDSTGFTLLGDLDLDLEEDYGEEEEEVMETPVHIARPSTLSDPASAATPARQTNVPFLFPSLVGDDRSWLWVLQHDRTLTAFCKDKTDDEIQAQWKERKAVLTQDYKRRHREALKKKKRKYTGSRAAGTSMRLRS